MSVQITIPEGSNEAEFSRPPMCEGNACGDFGIRTAERWPNNTVKRFEIHNSGKRAIVVRIELGNPLGSGGTVEDVVFPGQTNSLSFEQQAFVIGFIAPIRVKYQ